MSSVGNDDQSRPLSEEVGPTEAEIAATEELRKDLQEAFDVFDAEGEGTITTRKLFRIMRALGQNPTEAEVQDLINAVDDDGNGTIEFEEFVAMMTKKLTEPDTDEDIRAAFRVYDQEGKGHITAEDLEKRMNDLRTDLNPEEIAEMIRETDSTGDGHVTLDDLRFLMTENVDNDSKTKTTLLEPR